MPSEFYAHRSYTIHRCCGLAFLMVAAVVAEASAAGGTNQWRQRASLPEGAVFAATVVGQNGLIYVMTGFSGPDTDKLTPANRVYDPLAEQWRFGAPVPT